MVAEDTPLREPQHFVTFQLRALITYSLCYDALEVVGQLLAYYHYYC